jgi:hypothetical protein
MVVVVRAEVADKMVGSKRKAYSVDLNIWTIALTDQVNRASYDRAVTEVQHAIVTLSLYLVPGRKRVNYHWVIPMLH